MADGSIVTTGRRAQEELGRLRSDPAADRLGRHARHHHLADAEAARHSAGDFGRRVPVSLRRAGLPRGDRDDPDGHPGGAHRTRERAADARHDQLFAARLSGRPMPLRRVPRQRRGVAEQARKLRRDRRRVWRRPVPVDQRGRGTDESCGRPGTTPTGRRMALRPGARGLSTDVCVPISRLAECIAETEADIAETGLIAPIVGHVGDGNFHVLALMDADDHAEVARVEAFVARLNARALAHGRDLHRRARHRPGQDRVPRPGDSAAACTSCARIKQALDPQGYPQSRQDPSRA